MEYTAFYRKLRPKSFKEVIGQDHIIQTLQNQVYNDRVNHAYLFCGTRGTGKTSTAKIFAKLLNCENPKEFSPCNVCENCQALNENRNLNIIEIDAASNNSVEDIRNIREEVKYPPTNSLYKIYIIDEVHMLSIGAFNALLKTLEEPPKYVIFILATTDPQKIPVTILSRCQRFNFRRINSSEIVQHIKEYLKIENVTIEEKALKYIAKLSEGSMRDALSILDQCVSFYFGEEITLEKVMEITNSVDDEVFFILTDALINLNVEVCLIVIDEIILQGRDILQFSYDIITHLRNLLLVSIAEKNLESLELTEEKLDMLKNQSSLTNTNNIMKYINAFSEIQPFLRQSFNNRIIIETCCLKLCTSFSETDLTDVFNKIDYIENKLDELDKNPIYINTNESFSPRVEEVTEEKSKRELAIAEDFKVVIENWDSFVENFQTTPSIGLTLRNSIPNNLEDKVLYIICMSNFDFRIININKQVIEEKLAEVFNKEYNIIPIKKEDFDFKYNVTASGKPRQDTNPEDIFEKIDFNIDLT